MAKRMNRTICIFAFLFLSLHGFSQKFRLGTSIGTSHILWHENQMTLDLGGQLTFQLPAKKYQIFAELKALGNINDSPANPNLILNATNSTKLPTMQMLQTSYRGGQAEAGMRWNTSSGFTPSISMYSKSIARKITTSQSEYIEEQKYALHGLNAGLAYKVKWKQTSFELYGQIFAPLYQRITLYGQIIGEALTKMTTSNSPSYRTGMELRHQKLGLTLTYEQLNLGTPENQKSLSINSSQANILSSLITFYF
jgi:hypothetical protein